MVAKMALSDTFHVQAHRGASAQYLENTIEAILHAAKIGSHSIEIDVHLTQDNEWVVFHDFVLPKGCCYLKEKTRPTTEDMIIRDRKVLELTEYKVLPSFSKRFNDPDSGAKELEYKISTLQKVVDEMNSLEKKLGRPIVLDIEIKSNTENPSESAPPELLAEKMSDFLVKNAKIDQYLVRSFDLRVLKHLQKVNSKVRLAVLSDKTVGDFVKHAEGLKAEILAPVALVLSREKIALAKARGFKVIPWTVNDLELIRKLQILGVDGVTTDHPKRVLESQSSFYKPN